MNDPLKTTQDYYNDAVARAEKAEAELAAMKARNCATCANMHPGVNDQSIVHCHMMVGRTMHKTWFCADWRAKEVKDGE
jgi:hypothetical protein